MIQGNIQSHPQGNRATHAGDNWEVTAWGWTGSTGTQAGRETQGTGLWKSPTAAGMTWQSLPEFEGTC